MNIIESMQLKEEQKKKKEQQRLLAEENKVSTRCGENPVNSPKSVKMTKAYIIMGKSLEQLLHYI